MNPPKPSKSLRDYSKNNKESLKALLQARNITIFSNATNCDLMAAVSLYELEVLGAGMVIEDDFSARCPLFEEISAWWKAAKQEVVQIANDRHLNCAGCKWQIIERLISFSLRHTHSSESLNEPHTSSILSQVAHPLFIKLEVHLTNLMQGLSDNVFQRIPSRAQATFEPAFSFLARAEDVVYSPMPRHSHSPMQGIQGYSMDQTLQAPMQKLIHSPVPGISQRLVHSPMQEIVPSPMHGTADGHVRGPSPRSIQEPPIAFGNPTTNNNGVNFVDGSLRKRLNSSFHDASNTNFAPRLDSFSQRGENGASRLEPLNTSGGQVPDISGIEVLSTPQRVPDNSVQGASSGAAAQGSQNHQELPNSTIWGISPQDTNAVNSRAQENAPEGTTGDHFRGVSKSHLSGRFQELLNDHSQGLSNNSVEETFNVPAQEVLSFDLNTSQSKIPKVGATQPDISDQAMGSVPGTNHSSFLTTAQAISNAANTIVTRLASMKAQLDRDLKNLDGANRILIDLKNKCDEHFRAWQAFSEEYKRCIQTVEQLYAQATQSLQAYVSMIA